MKYRYILLLSALLIAQTAYSQDKILEKVIVGNEGNFTQGNATITEYIPQNGVATDGVFLAQNSIGLGDVVQSLSWFNDELFIVVNNSQKIVVANPDDYSQTGVIQFPDGSSPRQIEFISSTKAYVTDMNQNVVRVINPDERTVSETTITVGIQPENMVSHEGFTYVANYGYGSDSTIFKIDISNDLVVDTLYVGRGPGEMEIDENGTLWVICTGYAGDYAADWSIIPGTSKPGGLYGIDLNDSDGEMVVAELPTAGKDLSLSVHSDHVFVNTGGLRVFDISENAFTADTLLKGNFYSMAYEETQGVVYLSDVGDYVSASTISMYSEGTTDLNTFNAGISASSFLFLYDDMTGTSVNEEHSEIHGFTLSQNYPNPFNPSTTISYSLSQNSLVNLKVYDITGRIVAVLEDGVKQIGNHTVTFDAHGLSSGIYFYRLSSNGRVETRKMQLIK